MLVASLDALKINFDEQALWTLNFALALFVYPFFYNTFFSSGLFL
ncbi:hypothetical protein [uncultured Maribacter sp.]|nr:hypothetical protein [uncultured Maribacter sp.]